MFDGPEIEVSTKPHGNSKGSAPYFRTSASARQKLQTLATTHTPKAVIQTVTQEAGGELKIETPSDAPRNRQQISNLRRSTTGRDKNVLYSVMLECKATQGSEDMFVRDVKAAPSPQCVLFFDWQLRDMRRFLTNNKKFGIFTADTTYNLGEIYVTPTAYPQLMLEDVRSKQHPTMVGPILVHQQTDFASSNYFASTLISHNKQLRNILCFGSDGDKALVEAFSHAFPFATQLRCFIHLRRNVQEKLRALSIPHQVADAFLTDIFGKHCGSTYIEGLVDCTSEHEFDEKLQLLKRTWNVRELPYCPSSGVRFYSSFCQYQANVVKHHMRRDVREAVGLGCPPSIFTTNSSESLNASIKKKMDYKQHEWPQFNKLIREFVMSHRDEVIRSLSGRGQYRLTSEYNHLATSVNDWSKMTAVQRKKIVCDFDSAVIPISRNHPPLPAMSLLPSSSGYSSSSKSLSVSPEDSGILTIPLVTLQGMWEKAERLLCSKSEITPAPGSDPKARMVLSLTSDSPHFVRCKQSGQYICDSACIRWTSANICSHTLAVAETNGELLKFLHWYSDAGNAPNISTLAMQGLPSGRGRKGGQPKRKRIKQSSVPETFVAVTKSPPPAPPLPPNGSLNQSQGQGSGNISVASGAASNVTVTVPHSLPPPLIRTGSAGPSQPPNVNPFYVKFIAGNIGVCQGCKGSLKTSDNRTPTPPFDIVAARSENRPFRDAMGSLITPKRATVYHYHCRPQCIQAVEPQFILSSLIIPIDVRAKLTHVHKQHLATLFNINCE